MTEGFRERAWRKARLQMADHQLVNIPRGCSARQYSDLTICTECDLRWDTNDRIRPRCPVTGR